MIKVLKSFYKKIISFWLSITRKVLVGYYPILLEYPNKPQCRYGHGKPYHPGLYKLIDKERDSIRQLLESFLQFEGRLREISLNKPQKPKDPHWLNGWLPAFDALGIYGMIGLLKPKIYLEVGSGNSTKFARRAIRDLNFETKIISIDPQPRAEINSICDTIVRNRLEDADLSIMDQLESGDILYIDGSHYCFQNSDVTVVFLDVLPRLKPGVIVEFHDISLPYDYPPIWRERYYNEQYMLATTLLFSENKFRILLPNAFISEDAELKSILDPLWDNPGLHGVEKHGGSFWMKVV
ncbi:class I SAM-dependent methyltransferase [bacterium]|nr:class I SAM-dependent methyltransferase [bacterium]